MSRVVLVADSDTGQLIDVAGNAREGGRYKKFVKRMLSSDKNPVLDYGGNGGDSLTVSASGVAGKKITLMADSVVVSGSLTVGDKSVSDIASSQTTKALDYVTAGDGVSISKTFVQDGDNLRDGISISLDDSVNGKLEIIQNALDEGIVYKSDIREAISDLSVSDSDDIEDVKGTLKKLLGRLNELVA